jgi:RluA family pseudouridine synthase
MTLEERQQRLQELTKSLPGCRPHDSFRPLTVSQRFDRFTLLDYLDAYHPHYGRDHWYDLIQAGRILCKGKPLSPERIVRGGEQLSQWLPDCVEPEVSTEIRLIHEDEALLVLHKPAPLPMHPCGRFHLNTLSELLAPVFAPKKLHLIHRLDANTSGLVVFGFSKEAARVLHQQFENRRVKKFYLARVRGLPSQSEFRIEVRISETPCDAGARRPDPNGLPAETEFTLLKQFHDQTSLLEARPITGRTNQIRLHLWELGHPIVGDPVYLPDSEMGSTQTLNITDPPLCLQAFALELQHPETSESLRFEDTRASWASL